MGQWRLCEVFFGFFLMHLESDCDSGLPPIVEEGERGIGRLEYSAFSGLFIRFSKFSHLFTSTILV